MEVPMLGFSDSGKPKRRCDVVLKRVRHHWFHHRLTCVALVAGLACALLAAVRLSGKGFQWARGHEDRCPVGLSFGVITQLLPTPSKVLVREAKVSGALCGDRPRTVVSMTTFYGRMEAVSKVIDSILAQTCLPDQIYVFVSLVPRIDREFRHNHTRAPPKNLDAIAETLSRAPSVKVMFITDPELDFGPATKLLPALRLETDPRTHIITVDDDTLYHEDMILALSVTAQHAQAAVAVGFACEEYGWSAERGHFVVHGKRRRRCAGLPVEGTCHGWLDGVSGVLYQRGNIDAQIFNYSRSPHDCFLHDDVWFAAHSLSNNVQPYLISPGFTSRKVRFIESEDASKSSGAPRRPHSSSYFITQKLRQQGIDPVLNCAAYFEALARNLEPQLARRTKRQARQDLVYPAAGPAENTPNFFENAEQTRGGVASRLRRANQTFAYARRAKKLPSRRRRP